MKESGFLSPETNYGERRVSEDEWGMSGPGARRQFTSSYVAKNFRQEKSLPRFKFFNLRRIIPC